MKLREFIEQLQQLDPDADVKIRSTDDMLADTEARRYERDYVMADPVIDIRFLPASTSGRRTVCLV